MKAIAEKTPLVPEEVKLKAAPFIEPYEPSVAPACGLVAKEITAPFDDIGPVDEMPVLFTDIESQYKLPLTEASPTTVNGLVGVFVPMPTFPALFIVNLSVALPLVLKSHTARTVFVVY